MSNVLERRKGCRIRCKNCTHMRTAHSSSSDDYKKLMTCKCGCNNYEAL